MTGKPISIDALKNFDPVRYGSLSMANPLPLDDPPTATRPFSFITPASRATEDGLVYDITSQIGAWVRSRDRSNPLTYGKHHGSLVDRVYDFGYSQTGSFEYDYTNAIEPLVKQSDGRPMFDGYIVAVAAGGSSAQLRSTGETGAAERRPPKQFKDAGTPIIHMMSQSDYLTGIDARDPT